MLTDCHKPDMHGSDLTIRIRRAEAADNLPATPIIAITVNALAGEADLCQSAEKHGCLSTSFKLE